MNARGIGILAGMQKASSRSFLHVLKGLARRMKPGMFGTHLSKTAPRELNKALNLTSLGKGWQGTAAKQVAGSRAALNKLRLSKGPQLSKSLGRDDWASRLLPSMSVRDVNRGLQVL
jgi:hypothetical protein